MWDRALADMGLPCKNSDDTKADKILLHALICDKLNVLYERKNRDYGDSFGKGYGEYGMTMPVIRLEDKLNRLKSLLKSAAQVKDESIEDTLMDLANYAIMTLIERNILKGEKLEVDE